MLETLLETRVSTKHMLLSVVATVIGVPLLVILFNTIEHHWKVRQANGEWCIIFEPDGSSQTFYGAEDCGF